MCEMRFHYREVVFCCCFVAFLVGFFGVFFCNSLVKSMCSRGNSFLTQEKKYSMKYITQYDLTLLFEHSTDPPSHENLWHIHLYSDFLFSWSQSCLLQLDAAQQPLKRMNSHTSSPQSLSGIVKHCGELPGELVGSSALGSNFGRGFTNI